MCSLCTPTVQLLRGAVSRSRGHKSRSPSFTDLGTKFTITAERMVARSSATAEKQVLNCFEYTLKRYTFKNVASVLEVLYVLLGMAVT